MRSARWILLAAAALGLAACRERVPDADHDGFVASGDCDDSNPAVHAVVTGYLDADRDGVGAGPWVQFCTSGALPAGYAAEGADCAPVDATRWRAIVNPPADRDGDGFTARESVTLCVGSTLPEPYRAADRGLDCDDVDPALYRWVTLYRDQDGDGVGARPRTAPWTCIGASVPAGLSVLGYDVDDSNPAVTTDAADDDDVLALILD